MTLLGRAQHVNELNLVVRKAQGKVECTGASCVAEHWTRTGR